MYPYIVALIVITIGLYIIYKSYTKIHSYIEKTIIPSQNIKEIKKEMQLLDSSNTIHTEEDQAMKFSKITDRVDELLYLPIDFLYKLFLSYVIPLYYTFTSMKI